MLAVLMLGPAEMLGLLIAAFFYTAILGAGLGLFVYVAVQARRRGYSFWLWLLAGLASLNPLLILLVLAMLPDARKKGLREQEMKLLDAKLLTRRAEAPRLTGVVPAGSLGDQSTTAPAPRSVGDEETRG